MTITIHRDFEQGSDEWRAIRNGKLTASEFRLIISPKTLKPADNEKTRIHAFELAAQRINGPRLDDDPFQSADMIRGHEEEEYARDLYIEHFADVEQVGFITREIEGMTLGYSPDGLVGDRGLIECKSRAAKHQVATAHEWHHNRAIPEDFYLQVHAAMLISDRDWIDLLSYSNGMAMLTMRVERDESVIEKMLDAAIQFEAKVQAAMESYAAVLKTGAAIPTIYREKDIIV